MSTVRSRSSSADPASAKLATLRRFTEATRQSQGLEQLLEAALRCIEETFEACCAALLEGDGERLTLRAIRGLVSKAEAEQEYAGLCRLLTQQVRDARQPLLLEDASHLPWHGGKPVRSLLAVPLPGEASASAVLCVGAFAPRAFGPDEVVLLELMADRISLALADERSRSAEQSSHAQLEAVRAAALLFAEPIDLNSALQRIVDQARHIANAAYAALGLAHGDPLAPFNPWVFSGISEEEARRIGRMPRPVGLLGEVLSTGEVVRLEDASADPRFGGVPAHHPHLTSFLGVPIILRGRHLGDLYLANKVGGSGFTEEDEQTVRLLAQHAALAVESAQVRERTQGDMEVLRTTHAALEESEERLRRTLEDAPIGMAVVDLDGYFRRVNRVLCELVGRTPEELRELRYHDITHPEDLELELREMERLLRGQQDRFQIAKRYLRKDGSPVEVRLSRSLLRDERGQPLQFIAQTQDITEQNRVERALLEGERRFRALFDNSLEGILILDQKGHFLDANPSACALLRQPRSALLGRSFVGLADNTRVEQHEKQWQRFLLQGEQKGEFAVRLPDGQVLEVEFSARAHFMPGQHLVMMHDITRRKRGEAALRRSEAMLRLTMENLPVGVWIADEHGTIIQGNPEGQRIWGGARYVNLERLGEFKGWWADTGRPLAAGDWALARAVRRGETSIGEVIRIESFDGKKKVLLNSAVPVKDAEGRLLGALMVNEDITERLRTESELKLLAEASALVSTSLDLQATLEGVAHLAVKHLGDWCVIDLLEDGKLRPVTAAHRKPGQEHRVRELLSYPPDLHDEDTPISHVVRTGTPRLGEATPKLLARSATQNARYLAIIQALASRSIMLVPLTARDQTLGVLSIASADPERQYEPRDLIPALELAWRAALAIENARLHEQAQQANRMRKEMMAVVSHDLRNPLGAVSLRATAVERRAERAGDAATVADAQAMQRSARQMERLVSDMLDLVAIEVGHLTIKPQPQKLCSLLAEVEEMLVPLGEHHGVKVEVRPPASLVVLKGDRNRIVQVLSNLAGNAMKFTPTGGRVTVRAELEEGRVRLSVSDTGPGIHPEELPHIFDRYWRARGMEKMAGVGLGLAIVKGIVEAHGGSVRAESQPGEGSTFHVELPLEGPSISKKV